MPGIEQDAPSTSGVAPQGDRIPPNLHWAAVFAIGFFTYGLFTSLWLFVEASFVRKLRPHHKALWLYPVSIVMAMLSVQLLRLLPESTPGIVVLGCVGVCLCAVILFEVANFSMKSALEDYYNHEEPIGLRLSGWMTFFFGVFQFQYYFSRIREWKRTGVFVP